MDTSEEFESQPIAKLRHVNARLSAAVGLKRAKKKPLIIFRSANGGHSCVRALCHGPVTRSARSSMVDDRRVKTGRNKGSNKTRFS